MASREETISTPRTLDRATGKRLFPIEQATSSGLTQCTLLKLQRRAKAFLAALAESFAELGHSALRTFREQNPFDYARTFADYMPEGATLADILSDDRLEAISAQFAARVEKAARNGVETIH